jgi:CheY-like chemotaxis protein
MPSRTVLIVDDDADFRATLAEALEEEGWDVMRAQDGARGLEVLGACRPNVVVLDLMLPVLSGWDVLRMAREREDLKHIPVIVVTSSHAPKPVGAQRFLRKPLSLEQLMRAMDELCPRAAP